MFVKRNPKERLTTLLHHINMDSLRAASRMGPSGNSVHRYGPADYAVVDALVSPPGLIP